MDIVAVILAVLMYAVGETMFFIFKQRKEELLKTIFKCFATSCAVCLGLIAASFFGGGWRWLLLGGLIASTIADGVLNYRFIPGMFVFMAAHLFYIAAFIVRSGFSIISFPIYAVICLLFVFVFIKLRPLGELLKPGIIYAAVIGAMASMAIPLFFEGTLSGAILACGAVLFLASDVWLAKHIRFGSRSVFEVCSMTLYYTGQFLLAYGMTI